MRKLLVLLAVTVFLGVISAQATVITLTFDGLQDLEPIDNYYNGGTGGFGSGPGPNYGIAFSSDSLAIISVLDGGSGNFSDVPPPATNTIAFFLSGAGDTMDVAAGFTTGFAFYYAAAAGLDGSVDVYSGLDGTGTNLAHLDLPANGSYCGVEPYSCWSEVGVAFGGTAQSVVFSGSANYIGFADITLGSSQVNTPEPSTLMLLGSGFLGLAGVARRKLKV